MSSLTPSGPAGYFKPLTQQMRWLTLSLLVGVVAGLGAVLFEELLKFVWNFSIAGLTGYQEPAPGAPPASVRSFPSTYHWLFLVIPTLGGLISGLIVFLVAPEAEGHGTDAMINAFHHRGGYIRKRVPFVKIFASAITIGSGGSAGKEGPIAQIGAGFGSFLASVLNLHPRERRILVLAGAAAGIGAIFHAPLGAALFAPEVLYRDTGSEFEAILPCLISSIVAYSIFSHLYGRAALFNPGPVDFVLPTELLPYAVFGVLCAAVGYLYIKVFYGMRDRFFRRLNLPRALKPALGGFLIGLVGFVFPQVMGTGYAWVQMALEGKMVWYIMFLLALLKIVATSFTISSGGSGGVFGPSVFIGAMLGGAFGTLGHHLAPQWVQHPNAFVMVGIGGFFAGVAKVPLSSIIMACEMCSSYTLLVPLMLVSAICFVLLGNTSLYEKQVASRVDSPAHLWGFARKLMGELKEQQQVAAAAPAGTGSGAVVAPEASLAREQEERELASFPQAGGIALTEADIYAALKRTPGALNLTLGDLEEVYALAYEQALMRLTASLTAQDMMTAKVITVPRHAGLAEVAEILRRQGISGVPVVDAGGRVAGVISAKDFLLRARAKDPQHILDMIKAWVRAGSKDSSLFEAQKAEELMSAPAITVTPETPLSLIADIFIEQGISRVPVVDGEGRLVGLVSRSDLVKAAMRKNSRQ